VTQTTACAIDKDRTRLDFQVPDAEVEALVARSLRQAFTDDEPEWRSIVERAIGTRSLGWRRWLKRLITQGRNARPQSDVRCAYEQHWNVKPTVEQYVASLDRRIVHARWRGRGMNLAPQALRQVHMLYVLRAIAVIGARRVLEVGCGNGNVILSMAACAPDVAFAGVDLTDAGIAAARAVQELPALPASLVAASPAPVRDVGAHRRIRLQTGDARRLPYPDRAFDLVYTRLALEQMEQIREQALAEIARVADRAVVLVEPWRDFNLADPGRAYVKRMGYFSARSVDLARFGFKVVLATDDVPQKVQFSSGPVVALRA
jgi:SAM-dependent methyltransferase